MEEHKDEGPILYKNSTFLIAIHKVTSFFDSHPKFLGVNQDGTVTHRQRQQQTMYKGAGP